jgi:hypothetical protein
MTRTFCETDSVRGQFFFFNSLLWVIFEGLSGFRPAYSLKLRALPGILPALGKAFTPV